MNKARALHEVRLRRARRNRAKFFGSPEKPRLAVLRSNKSISCQLIDDVAGKTLAAASSRELPKETLKKNKTEQALLVGALIAEKAAKHKITQAVFDRRAYHYHGRVPALAEGARKGGLTI